MQRAQGLAGGIRSGIQNGVRSGAFGEATAAPELIETAFGVRHASRQILQQRMKSVTNIQKITSAMKMVAASRLKGAQIRAEQSRGIWQPFTRMLGDAPDMDVPKDITVAVSSDRGLCGGINSNVAKAVRGNFAALGAMAEEERDYKLIIVGEKARGLLQRDQADKFIATYTDTTKIPTTFRTVGEVSDAITKNEYDALRVIFNKYKSAISFVPTMITIGSPATVEKRGEDLGFLNSYEFEDDDKPSTLQDLHEFQVACTLYHAMMENACSELGSRVSAMDNSSKNAKEMKESLTLLFNRSRQAAITTELIEIISGAAALEG